MRRIALGIVSLCCFGFVQPAAAIDDAILTYCKDDIQRLCAGVQPGGGRILKCLKENKMQMSVGCAQGLAKMKKGMGQ
jgi:hypothetical protein